MPEKNTKFTSCHQKETGKVDFTYGGPVFQTVSLGKPENKHIYHLYGSESFLSGRNNKR